jgi:hypothetical protein
MFKIETFIQGWGINAIFLHKFQKKFTRTSPFYQ